MAPKVTLYASEAKSGAFPWPIRPAPTTRICSLFVAPFSQFTLSSFPVLSCAVPIHSQGNLLWIPFVHDGYQADDGAIALHPADRPASDGDRFAQTLVDLAPCVFPSLKAVPLEA